MTPEKLSKAFMDSVVMENLDIYKKHLLHTPASKDMTEARKKTITFFSGLSRKEQELVFDLIREIQVDTVSNVLGVIDGVVTLDKLNKDLVLTFKGSKEPINGSLQEYFLQQDDNE